MGLMLATTQATAEKNSRGYSPTSDNQVVIGQSLPLTGPSGQLGREYQAGALAWFNEVNRRGGLRDDSLH